MLNSLETVIEAAREAWEAGLKVALPGRVEAYDATTQKATVKPLLRRRHEDEDGAVSYVPRNPISNVPVVFPGGGGYRLIFPLAVGDTVLLVFGDESMDAWLSKGGDADPADVRRHSLTDAICIPCLRSFATPWSDAPSGKVAFGKNGSNNQIQITATEIHLGPNPLDAVALASKVDSELDKIWSALNAHTHPTAATGLPSPPVPGPPGTVINTSLPVGSTLVKVKE